MTGCAKAYQSQISENLTVSASLLGAGTSMRYECLLENAYASNGAKKDWATCDKTGEWEKEETLCQSKIAENMIFFAAS